MNSNLPKYKQVTNRLQEMIEAGDFAGNGRLPSGRELAQLMGVTQMTINRGLEDLVNRGILERRVGAGTFLRNSGHVAKSAERGAARLRIGILCHYQLNRAWYSQRVADAIERYFAGKPVTLSSFVRDGQEYLDTVQEYRLDAVIVISPWREHETGLLELAGAKVPFVVIGCRFPSLAGYCFSNDDFGMASEAVKYLNGLGHRQIGLVMSPICCPSTVERAEGYFAGMCRQGLPVNPAWIPGGMFNTRIFSDAEESALILELLRSDNCPTALITMFYSSTLNVYRAAGQAGLKIGRDLSVLGFDDPESAEHLNPALTAFKQSLEEIVVAALGALENLVNGVQPGAPLEFFSTLSVRESCSSPIKI